MEGVVGKCRLCMKRVYEDSKDIFKEKYAKQILEMFAIEIEDTANWPTRACSECIDFLQEIRRFEEKITESHQMLYNEIYQPLLKETSTERTLEDQEDKGHLVDEDKKVDSPDQKEFEEQMESEEVSRKSSSEVKPLESDSARNSANLIAFDSDPEQSSSAGKVPMESDQKNSAAVFETIQWDELIVYDSDVDLETFDLTYSKADEEPQRKKKKGKKMDKTTVQVNPSLIHKLYKPLTEEQEELETLMVEMDFFKCHNCEELTDCENLHKLRKHVQEQHDVKSYKICCELPLLVAPMELYDHIRLHQNPDAFKCNECGKRNKSSNLLTSHCERQHVDSPTCICPTCGKGFNKECYLKRHFNDQHAPKVPCEYCKKEYTPGIRMRRHIGLMHEIENNFLCGICGRGFTYNSLLINHIRDHSGPHGGNRKKKPKPPTSRRNVYLK